MCNFVLFAHFTDAYLSQVTHGFPQNPSPMFLSQKFAIENRSGLEDQQIQPVLKKLAELKAPQISSEAGPGQSGSALPIGLHQLIQYVSDWHLLVFLKSTGLFSEVRVLASTLLLCSDNISRTIGNSCFRLQAQENREITICSTKPLKQTAGKPS